MTFRKKLAESGKIEWLKKPNDKQMADYHIEQRQYHLKKSHHYQETGSNDVKLNNHAEASRLHGKAAQHYLNAHSMMKAGLKAAAERERYHAETLHKEIQRDIPGIHESLEESFHNVGDTVKSNIDAQGLKKGQKYKVTGKEHGKFGTVTYHLDNKHHVINGHMVLDKVNESETLDETLHPSTHYGRHSNRSESHIRRAIIAGLLGHKKRAALHLKWAKGQHKKAWKRVI